MENSCHSPCPVSLVAVRKLPPSGGAGAGSREGGVLVSDGAAIRRAQVDIRGNRESTRFRILAGTVFSSAVGAVFTGLATEHRSVSWAELLVFGAAAALAGLLSVRSGSTTALSLDMPVLLAAGLVFGPGVGGAIALVSYVDPREWRHEISISRAICNRGQTALSVIGGSLAFIAVGGQLGIWPGSLLAGLLALATDISINYVLVALMTSVRTGVSAPTALSSAPAWIDSPVRSDVPVLRADECSSG